MGSGFQHNHLSHQQPEMKSALMRYRSAPSSYFQDQIDRELCSQFFNRPSSPETERIFARFMTSGSSTGGQNVSRFQQEDQIMLDISQETEVQKLGNYASFCSQSFYESQAETSFLISNSVSKTKYEGRNSMEVDQLPPMAGSRSNSNLMRHGSSPAGLFSDTDIDFGYGATSSMGNISSRKPSSSTSGLVSPIAEMEMRTTTMSNPESGGLGEGSSCNYMIDHSLGSWENLANFANLAIVSESVMTRPADYEGTAFAGLRASQPLEGESGRYRPPLLAHHLSLPKTLPDILFRDSVPCKIRAKRGCATHPRSIAERVRRSRISERMRKLQELVPNMDKQTNTAEMLDLALEYIKDLQNKVKVLSDNHEKCKCANKQH